MPRRGGVKGGGVLGSSAAPAHCPFRVMITSIVAKITFREFILHAMTSMSIHVLLQSSASEQHETDLGIRSRSRNVAVRSGVASYWALDTCPPPSTSNNFIFSSLWSKPDS